MAQLDSLCRALALCGIRPERNVVDKCSFNHFMIMYSYNNISHAIDDDLTLYYYLGILIHLRPHTKDILAKHLNI